MSYTVTPEYQPRGSAYHRPWVVRLNDRLLLNKQLNLRRFKDSKSAAIAGAKEVDRRKLEGSY